jgi:1-pyrroline-5-carboxylate dehydrogenase
MDAIFKIPTTHNEPILNYKPDSTERKAIVDAIAKAKAKEVKIPMVIGGKAIYTDKLIRVFPPHEIKHTLGYFSKGTADHVKQAIDAALQAKENWTNLSWEKRAAIFLKAADLISGPYRAKLNAATMLGQSKNVFQAEIDSACEMIDFLRYNVRFMQEIYCIQPESGPGIWNMLDYRPLEGFVFAITPFNFTAIAGNLPMSPALMGNTVVWKPSENQAYSAHVLMEIFMEAGLPDGVINLVFCDGPEAGEVIFNHKEFAGLHFTGSSKVFTEIWQTISSKISMYRNFPRIVGETGGKDFVLAHASANPKAVSVALLRGAFEYQGQKCSAASRAYIPQSMWNSVKELLVKDIQGLKMGSVEDFSCFVNAVISEKSFDKLVTYIEATKKHSDAEILIGGGYDKSKGYFVEPTVIVTQDPKYVTMCDELFGPVLTIYVYPDNDFDSITKVIDETSPYALTGAIFCQDKYIIEKLTKELRYAAGNFYINDKPTGAVVGQQPFGGSRASGTNDKAGSMLNLLRWVSPRTIKETFNPPINYRYPFME